MIAPRVEEALVNCSALELVSEVSLLLSGEGVDSKHLSEGISLVLEPKLVVPLNVFHGHVEVGVILRVVHDFVGSVRVEGSGLLLDLTGEPFVPCFETIMRIIFINVCKVIIVDSWRA